jgi:hypothetical protein
MLKAIGHVILAIYVVLLGAVSVSIALRPEYFTQISMQI